MTLERVKKVNKNDIYLFIMKDNTKQWAGWKDFCFRNIETLEMINHKEVKEVYKKSKEPKKYSEKNIQLIPKNRFEENIFKVLDLIEKNIKIENELDFQEIWKNTTSTLKKREIKKNKLLIQSNAKKAKAFAKDDEEISLIEELEGYLDDN